MIAGSTGVVGRRAVGVGTLGWAIIRKAIVATMGSVDRSLGLIAIIKDGNRSHMGSSAF